MRLGLRGLFLAVLAGTGGACGLIGESTPGSSQRHSRPLAQLETVDGVVVVLTPAGEDDEVEREYEQGIRDTEGRIWSILQNEAGLALRCRPRYRGHRVRVSAWKFPRANYLDVYELEVLDEMSATSSRGWKPERAGDRQSLSGVIVCIGCELESGPDGGAHAQCNLFSDHEHGLLLDDGTILTLLDDPSATHGKGWDLRHNPLYLGKRTQVVGRRINATKLLVVEDVRLLPR